MPYLLDAYVTQNIGDDMMISELIECNPDLQFAIRPSLKGRTQAFLEFDNLRVGSDGREGLSFFRRLRGIVTVGGSMFMDRRGRGLAGWLRHRKMYMLRLLAAAGMRVTGRSYHVVGANIGPVETRLGTWMFRALLSLANTVSVRDEASYLWLPSGVRERAVLAPDMAFSYLERLSTPSRSVNGSRCVAISCMSMPRWVSSDGYQEFLVRLVDQLLADGLSVRLFAFQGGENGDQVMARAVRRAVTDSERVSVVIYDGHVHSFLGKMRECDSVVATRFHSVVAALAFQLPVSVVSYSSKIDNMLADLKFSGPIHHVGDDPRVLVSNVLRDLRAAMPVSLSVGEAARHALSIRAGLPSRARREGG